MSFIFAVTARWSKSLKLLLSIAVHKGGLAKNHFWLVTTQKERIEEQLNYFWNMCPKPFLWAKNKRKLFSNEKSRGPLSASAALKSQIVHWCTSQSLCWKPQRDSTMTLKAPSARAGALKVSEQQATDIGSPGNANAVFPQKSKTADKDSSLS